MNQNELRIGNLLNYGAHGTATVIDVKASGKIKIHIHSKESQKKGYVNPTVHALYLDPITLTPEWLERCGGIRPYEYDSELWQIGLLDFKWHDEYGLCQWDREGGTILFGTIHYNHLHQLQNLIYILTGMELTIKEI